jgi:hypothetical protein
VRHSVLFTGHMIDKQDRKDPRFPPYKEQAVKKEIEKFLLKEKEIINELKGIAGGACGGDIIFHEVCQGINIPSEVYLAEPVEDFKKNSVSFAGKDWEKRFHRLIITLPVYVFSKANENDKDNVWVRANIWMLDTALKNGGKNMTLMALWDGKAGDGPGGAEHMIKVAREKGSEIKIIDINKL